MKERLDFVADARDEPGYSPQMVRAEKISEDLIGPGTRFHAELKRAGRTISMVVEFTEPERPR